MTLADGGLGRASKHDLMKVAEKACASGEPIPVTSQMVFSALKAANAEGKPRKEL